jgi:hypothetical protein
MVLGEVLAIVVQQFGMDILQAGIKLFEEPKPPKIDDSIRFQCPECKLTLQYPGAITEKKLLKCDCGFVFPVTSGFWRCDCGKLTLGLPINSDVSVCHQCDLLWNTCHESAELFLCRCRFIYARQPGEILDRSVCCDKTLDDMYQIPRPDFVEPVWSIFETHQRSTR